MAPKKKPNSKKTHRKTTTTAASSSQTHPRELISNILSRLPVKTLIRFKLVSKQWRHVITHRDFISLHLRRSPQSLLIHSHESPSSYGHQLHFYCPHDARSNPVSVIHPLLRFPGHDVHHPLEIIGSTNGVVCISQHLFAQNLTLWNPATRVYRTATAPRLNRNPLFNSRASVGLGFDPSRNDYKIVRIISSHLFLKIPDVAEVFSLRSGRWKTLSITPKFWVTDVKCDCVVKGVPYWGSATEYRELYLLALTSFDVRNEVFDVTLLPWSTQGKAMCVGEIREGRIGAVVWEKGSESAGNQVLDVWMKEEESGRWNKLYTIEELEVMGKVLGFYGDRGILLEWKDEDFKGSILSFLNLENREVEDDFSTADSLPGTFKAVRYKESLVHIPMVGHCII